jgi:hypothetical protein
MVGPVVVRTTAPEEMTTMTKVEDRPAIHLAKEALLADREWLIPAGDDQLRHCWLCTFTHFNLKLLTVHLGIGKPNQHLVERLLRI